MEKFPYVDRDRKVSRELGLFQQDIRCLSISKIKKVKAFSYMIMQLKRFTRDELCMLTEYCDALIKEKSYYIDNKCGASGGGNFSIFHTILFSE